MDCVSQAFPTWLCAPGMQKMGHKGGLIRVSTELFYSKELGLDHERLGLIMFNQPKKG